MALSFVYFAFVSLLTLLIPPAPSARGANRRS
jgi:hypothetical protein